MTMSLKESLRKLPSTVKSAILSEIRDVDKLFNEVQEQPNIKLNKKERLKMDFLDKIENWGKLKIRLNNVELEKPEIINAYSDKKYYVRSENFNYLALALGHDSYDHNYNCWLNKIINTNTKFNSLRGKVHTKDKEEEAANRLDPNSGYTSSARATAASIKKYAEAKALLAALNLLITQEISTLKRKFRKKCTELLKEAKS